MVSRKRKILIAAVEFAAELKLLAGNPIRALKWTAAILLTRPIGVRSPIRCRRAPLLNAVREQGPSGTQLVAFFGCLCCAAMRP